jgi:hypothetical protein
MSATSTIEQDAIAEELARDLADPMWRISNLYKIITKTKTGETDADGNAKEASLVIQFKPNRAQRRFLSRLWARNVILKARQLGFTTLICIAWLDHALFNPNSRCGIVAQDRDTAEAIFTDKVKFAYDNLPDALKQAMPLKKCTSTELRFGHNDSMIRVATSVRGTTIHRLHISEFGKICAKYPDKAQEVMTGSIPAVPLDGGIIVIESTAEGQDGDFAEITHEAMAKQQAGKTLNERDYRLHFFAWWDAEEYEMDPEGIIITDKDHQYFDALEPKIGRDLPMRKRAWYVATRDADFKSKPERMWQEYPSTPEEAFQRSKEGTYYVNEFALARKQGRITTVPWEKAIPVNTFWDIGLNDEMTIWFHQRIGIQNRFIRYYENSGETFSHYVSYMQSLGYVWGRHYLPHDGDTKRLGTVQNWTPKQMLEDLGLRNVEIVPRIDRVQTGIQMVRDVFGSCWFDETNCKQGLIHLENYRKEWDARLAVWKDEPRHDKASNGADAFRGFAQGFQVSSGAATMKRRKSNWRTA